MTQQSLFGAPSAMARLCQTDAAATHDDTAPCVFTIGYEAKTFDGFVERLKDAGVSCLIDVRATAQSRKMGFGKMKLRAGLHAAGIAYVHQQTAGNPHRKLKDVQQALRLYAQHLRDHPEIVEAVRTLAVQKQRVALMCFEAEARLCHRSVLLAAMTAGASPPIRTRHL